MIPPAFDYVRPASLEEAIKALVDGGEDAKLLAGGHSLIPAMKLRIARPGTLVDIGRIGGLSYVREDGDAIAIGALTRHHDVAASDVLRRRCAIMSSAEVAGRPCQKRQWLVDQARPIADEGDSIVSALSRFCELG